MLFDLLIILSLYVTLVEFQMEFVKAAANLPNVTVMTEKVGEVVDLNQDLILFLK